MKNVDFSDITLCGCCKNRYFGETYGLHHQDRKKQRTTNNVSSVLQMIVTVNVVPSFLILSALMMETMHSSETSAFARATRNHIQEDGFHHSEKSVDLFLFRHS
jgi:hypothetical protein